MTLCGETCWPAPAVALLSSIVLPHLELQYGKVGWRPDVLTPFERFLKGTIEVPARPAFGVALNEDVIRAQSLPL